MKYYWEITWDTGAKYKSLYAVEKEYAERAVAKCIKENMAYCLDPIEPIKIRFIPEKE